MVATWLRLVSTNRSINMARPNKSEALNLSDVSVCETNRGTWLKEGFGSSFNLRSEDEIEI